MLSYAPNYENVQMVLSLYPNIRKSQRNLPAKQTKLMDIFLVYGLKKYSQEEDCIF